MDRAARARKAAKDAATAKALGANSAQVAALREMFDEQLNIQAASIRKDSIKIGIASFVAGAGVKLLVTLLVHPIS